MEPAMTAVGVFIGFGVLLGFLMMLYVAGRGAWTAGRQVKQWHRTQRDWRVAQKAIVLRGSRLHEHAGRN